MFISSFLGYHHTQNKDIQHNDTQHNDTQYNDPQYNDSQHNDTQHDSTLHNYTEHSNIQKNNTQPIFIEKSTKTLYTFDILLNLYFNFYCSVNVLNSCLTFAT